MKKEMDLERVGGRQRDKTQVYAEESDALDRITKEVGIVYLGIPGKVVILILLGA